MIKVQIGGTEIEVRALTGKEILALKAEGVPISRLGFDATKLALDLDKADEAMEKVFDIILTDEQRPGLDELGNDEYLKLWRAILDETFPASDEVKN